MENISLYKNILFISNKHYLFDIEECIDVLI